MIVLPFIIAVAFVAAFLLGIFYRKLKAEKAIVSAEKEAEKIIANAKELAETRKKEVILEGKEEIHKFRNETEKELSDRRKDIQHQERRIIQELFIQHMVCIFLKGHPIKIG